MKTLEKLTLKEMEKEFVTINELEQANFLGGSDGGNVVINAIRYGFGQNTTVSQFTACAFDNNGNISNTMTGYFLEPAYNGGSNGPDTAIPYGQYSVVPSTFKGQPGYYEVANVPGRTDVKIHSGNFENQTTGCPLTGTSVGGSGGNEDYYVNKSKDKLTELTNFFKANGGDGIILNIGTVVNHE